MKKTFGINGFGRIGRVALRVWWEAHRDTLDLKVINTSGSMGLDGWAHLLKYDTNYGIFPGKISFKAQQTRKEVSDANSVLGTLTVDGYDITVTAQRDPAKIPWKKLGADTVVESTGVFRTVDKAKAHFEGGAKTIIISAPGKGEGISTGI